MLWLIIVMLAAILVLLSIILFGRKDNNSAELCERGFTAIRRDIEDNFSRSRMEQQQSFSMQQEMVKSSFTDFMKFLHEFRDAVRQADENSAEKLTSALQSYGDRTDKKTSELIKTLEEKIRLFEESTASQLNSNRQLLDEKLKSISEENSTKLDEMKKTVDEKLQSSMEKHFNDSFKLISQRLEEVHKGLGEMQSLATGVGDLKKVLTNVKTRGNIGEIQLSVLLEQYLVADQYAANVATVPNSKDIVEFAIKLPGKDEDTPLLLPIDSKFPVEDYQRLLDTYEQFPRLSPEVKKAQEQFAKTVKKCASDIRSKYIYPPATTAFGLMFVPSEGIYAEILRMPGLFEKIQSEFQISVVGPSNLVAFLNSLQMGFKTLAIEKRSNEVWQILGAVKTEFGKFGDQMDKTRRSLESVVNHMEAIGTRSRALERRLRNVQELSGDEAAAVLELTGDEQI